MCSFITCWALYTLNVIWELLRTIRVHCTWKVCPKVTESAYAACIIVHTSICKASVRSHKNETKDQYLDQCRVSVTHPAIHVLHVTWESLNTLLNQNQAYAIHSLHVSSPKPENKATGSDPWPIKSCLFWLTAALRDLWLRSFTSPPWSFQLEMLNLGFSAYKKKSQT